ncbi:MAG: holo-ACP synthase [Dehalococcoidia bacterium]|tara:strand:+ start:350 stop:739 length:390 start_codon:yes stop_codon:yes gene_type:complete
MDINEMQAIGIDAIEIDRIKKVYKKFGDKFLSRIYTQKEIAFCRGRILELSARFAGKEAAMKALGTGIIGISWKEIEILSNRRGKPVIHFHGKAKKRANDMKLRATDISITHLNSIAIVIVVGVSEKEK